MMPEKFNPIERALIAAASMPAPKSRQILQLICEAGMTTKKDIPQPSEGDKHYAKREKIIRRMKGAADRVLDYAKHETLRNCEKHFRETGVKSAEGDSPTLPERLAFKKPRFTEEFLAALREESSIALGIAGQQLFDEIGSDNVWKLPDKSALSFLDARANLLANAPDEIHAEVMQTIQDGLEHGETKKELMARISTAFEGIKQTRADTIANTETAAAFNFARDKAMRKAGITHKQWLHSQSPLIKEPRPTHVEADGQTRPIDEPFYIGGVSMMHPGDNTAPADEVINCHCVAIPVEAPIESGGEKEGHPFRGNQWTGGKPAHEMTEDERKKEIARLKEEHKDALSTPLMSEGGISPMQVGMMSERQKAEFQEKTMRRMSVESRIKELSKPSHQLTSEDYHRRRSAALTEKNQIESLHRTYRDLGVMSHKPSGELKPKYQRVFDANNARLAELRGEFPDL